MFSNLINRYKWVIRNYSFHIFLGRHAAAKKKLQENLHYASYLQTLNQHRSLFFFLSKGFIFCQTSTKILHHKREIDKYIINGDIIFNCGIQFSSIISTFFSISLCNCDCCNLNIIRTTIAIWNDKNNFKFPQFLWM